MTTLILGDVRHVLALVLATIATLGRRLAAALPRRRSHVTAFGCPVCDQWVKPRHFIVAANICRDCVPLVPFPGRGGRS